MSAQVAKKITAITGNEISSLPGMREALDRIRDATTAEAYKHTAMFCLEALRDAKANDDIADVGKLCGELIGKGM